MTEYDSPANGARGGSLAYLLRICGVAALGGLLFGYDTAVINGAIGLLEQHFSLSAAMKGWAASSALLGCVLGVSVAGRFCDRYGRKPTLAVSGILFLVSAIGTAVPRTIGQLVLFRIMAGAGVGIASMTSPMYIAEVAPARFRGRLVALNQLAIISGMLLIYFVNYAIARQGNAQWQVTESWRWMFASGILPAAAFLLLLAFTPESPRWLALHGREREAVAVLERVGGREFAHGEMRSIVAVAERVRSAPIAPATTRRILTLGVILAILQQTTGINVFLYFGTEIFRKLGSSLDTALLETVAVGAANLLFTVVAIGTVDRVGRKFLMIAGSAGMGVCLVAMGLSSGAQLNAWWMLAWVLGYISCFALSVGPVTWILLTEIFPTEMRARALSIATFALWTANFVVSQTFPMMDASAFLLAHFHHAFPFFLYGGMCVILLLVVAIGVPETKNRSLEEIESRWLSC